VLVPSNLAACSAPTQHTNPRERASKALGNVSTVLSPREDEILIKVSAPVEGCEPIKEAAEEIISRQ
jgi:hypothetical protein